MASWVHQWHLPCAPNCLPQRSSPLPSHLPTPRAWSPASGELLLQPHLWLTLNLQSQPLLPGPKSSWDNLSLRDMAVSGGQSPQPAPLAGGGKLWLWLSALRAAAVALAVSRPLNGASQAGCLSTQSPSCGLGPRGWQETIDSLTEDRTTLGRRVLSPELCVLLTWKGTEALPCSVKPLSRRRGQLWE